MKILELITHLEHRVRPLLSKILPVRLFIANYSLSRNTYLKLLSKLSKDQKKVKSDFYPQNLFRNKICFKNDLANAAGFDKDGSLLEFNYLIGAGYAVVGTVLEREHTGNIQSFFGLKANPWTPLANSNSAINSLGLPNKGVDQVIQNIRKFKHKYSGVDFPIGLSVMGHPLDSPEDKLAGVLKVIREVSLDVDFIEINESCPNCEHNNDWERFKDRIKSIINLRNSFEDYLPILIKFNSIANPEELLDFLAEVAVDGIVISNTLTDYSELKEKLAKSDQPLFDYYTTNYAGGVSGQIIKTAVINLIEELDQIITRKGIDLKIIHVGGINSPEDLKHSRSFKNVILREWYTGLLEHMGTKKWETIYPEILGQG